MRPEFQMTCEQNPEESRYVVTLRGDIDVAAVPALRDVILALDADVDVDCEGVTFIDSSGLGLFAQLTRKLQTRDRHVALYKLSGSCYRLFELTGLAGYVDVTRAEM
jgi:anti-sigma B factor antagonist